MMMPHLRCRHLDSRHTNRVAFQFAGQVHRVASVCPQLGIQVR